MTMPLAQAWHWITGQSVGKLAAPAFAAEEGIRVWISRARRRDNAKVLEVLRATGMSKMGLAAHQIAAQQGWDAPKAEAALRRLQKSGEVRESQGRWYKTSVAVGKSGAWGFRLRRR